MPRNKPNARGGGLARAAKLPPAERSLIASKAALTRWYSLSRDQRDRLSKLLVDLYESAADAKAKGDEKIYLQAVNTIARYEQMLWIMGRQPEAQVSTVEMDQIGADAQKKFEIGQQPETVIEEKK
jgi:hypothetical protein